MVTDPIADLLTRMRNASLAGLPTVKIPASKTKERILQVLLDEGYIGKFETVQDEPGKPQLKVFLKYSENGQSVLRVIDRLSTPGRRRYVGYEDIPKYRGGLGTIVISTSQGMLCDREARVRKVGGELICSVF